MYTQNVKIKEKFSDPHLKYDEHLFHRAVKFGDLKLFDKCIENNVSPNTIFPERATALHVAAEYGNIIIAKRLLSMEDIIIDPISLHGFTPLMLATQVCNLHMMTLFISYNANKYTRDYIGRTLLHWTVLGQNIEGTLLLLKLGLDPNIYDSNGLTSLYYAATIVCNYKITKILLQHDADPFLVVYPNQNVFFELCLITTKKEHEQILNLVLSLVNNINVRENFGKRTALHMVAISNYIPTAKMLLDNGANRNVKDNRGLTPVKLAKIFKNREIGFFLERYMPGTPILLNTFSSFNNFYNIRSSFRN